MLSEGLDIPPPILKENSAEYLELLAKGEIQKLCKLAKVNEVKLSEFINIIKNLNPKPATSYADENFRIDPPDVIIEKTKKGWKVELKRSTLPTLVIISIA